APVHQAQLGEAGHVPAHEGTRGGVDIGRVSIHSHECRSEAEAVGEPKTRPAAELDREVPERAGITLEGSSMDVVRRLEVAHVPLQPRLPADAEAAERPWIADVPRPAELGDVELG